MAKVTKTAYKKGFVEGNSLRGALGSTPDVDRDGDIIDPLGINTANFEKNPQLLWSHDARELPIGKVTKVKKTAEGLEFDAEFAVKENPFAKKVRDLFEGGFLNAFSIGFIPKDRENETITQSELVEISVVNIPANASALLSREYKAFQKDIQPVVDVDGMKKDIAKIVVKELKKAKKDVKPKLTAQQKRIKYLNHLKNII